MNKPNLKTRKQPAIKPNAEHVPAAIESMDNGWNEVDPTFLVGSRSAAPSLALGAFPERLRETVSAIATARCINIDLVAASVIAIISGAIGNRVRLSITDRRTEPGALFVVLVTEPGEGKTEALDVAREAFHAMQASGRSRLVDADHVVAAVERERNLDARRTLAREGVEPVSGPKRQASEKRQLLLTEATVAGIRNALAASPAGRVFVADELVNAMQLTGGGEAIKARGLLLESFDGKPRVIANARDGEITIEALQLTILGGTQPDRVPRLLGPAHDGMLPRFLWCAPNVERLDKIAESDGPLNDLIGALSRLADIEPHGRPGAYPRLVAVSAEAREVLRAANADWNARMPMSSMQVKSLLARARTQSLRLALNLALGERALAGEELPGGEITGADAARGVQLMDSYFLPMGERVITEFNRRDIDPPAVQLARFLARLGKPTVSARDDIRRGLGSPVRDADEIARNMEELRLRGIVRPQERAAHTSGRPTKLWEVNPNLVKVLKAIG